MVIRQAAARISKSLQARVSIENGYLGWLNRLTLQNVVVYDQKNDTLFAINQLFVTTNDWFLLGDTTTIKYAALEGVHLNLNRTDTVWNYDILNNLFSKKADPKTVAPSKGNSKPILLNLKQVYIKDFVLHQYDFWKGKLTQVSLGEFSLNANHIDFKKGEYAINSIDLSNARYTDHKVAGRWSLADSVSYYQKLDSLQAIKKYPESWNSGNISLSINQIKLHNFGYGSFHSAANTWQPGYFEPGNIFFNQISGSISQLTLKQDTITARVSVVGQERSGLKIKKLNTRFKLHPQLMEFDSLDLEANNSKLGPYYAMQYKSIDRMEYFVDSVTILSNISKGVVNMRDIAIFAPALKKIDQIYLLNGRVFGPISNLKIDNLVAKTGNSQITGALSLTGLPSISNSHLNLNTPRSVFHLADLRPWAPELIDRLKKTPALRLSPLAFNGKFSGSLANIDLHGLFLSKTGSIDARILVNLQGAKKGFEGKIKSAHVDAGALLGVKDMGAASFEGEISSHSLNGSDPLQIKGTVHSVLYKGYQYQNLGIKGNFVNSKLDATITANDPNLVAAFSTNLNFLEKNQSYNAIGNITRADLRNLGISKDSILVSGLFDVNFKGSNLDNFTGYARFYDAELYDGVRLLSFDSLSLMSNRTPLGAKTLEIGTNEANIFIEGNYNISDLPNTFQAFIHHYYPSLTPAPLQTPKNQNFLFNIKLRNIEPFLYYLNPNLKGLNNSDLKGSINTDLVELMLNVDVPYVAYQGVSLNDISLKGVGDNTSLLLNGSVNRMMLNDSLGFPNVALKVNTIQDSTQFELTTSMGGPLGDAAINGMVIANDNGITATFQESSFILNNKKWLIGNQGKIALSNGYLFIQNLFLNNAQQQIKVYTQPAEEGNWNTVYLDINRLILDDLLPFVMTDPRLEGEIDGHVAIESPLKNPAFKTDLTVHNFRFNNDSVGTVSIRGNYDMLSGKLSGIIDSKNPFYDFSGDVNLMFPKNKPAQIDTRIQLRNERISLLNKYLSSIFKDIDGFANGSLRILGEANKPKIIGDVAMSSAQFTVKYTGVTYFVDTATLYFGSNYIDFGSLSFADDKNRTGRLNGIMYHNFFDSLFFNLNVGTEGLRLLKTNPGDNDLFYGDAVGKGRFSLYGPLNNLQMNIQGSVTDSSHIIVANKADRESGEADFLSFKTYGTEMSEILAGEEMNLHIDMELVANPLCRIDVLMDEISGDMITARGNGNLRIRTGSTDETVMRGRYNIESGKYDFSFQTLIKKPFTLVEGENNYIEWSGNPMDANLNIMARYVAENVSLRDLLNTDQSRTILDESALNYKGNVYINTRLTGLLSKPDIAFKIEFPTGSPMQSNLSAQSILQQIENDKSEMLRQVTYLIVFRSFAPFRQGAGSRVPGADLAINTLSDLITDELSKELSRVFQGLFNVRVGTNVYNSGSLISSTFQSNSSYDRVNFNVMLNKTWLNNRIVLNAGGDADWNFGGRSVISNRDLFLLPNVSVEFILTSDRKLRAILFRRDNLDFSGTRRRTGISLTYRKEFDKVFKKAKDNDLILYRQP